MDDNESASPPGQAPQEGQSAPGQRGARKIAAIVLAGVLGVAVVGVIVLAAVLSQSGSNMAYDPPAPSAGSAVSAESPVGRGKDCEGYPQSAAVSCLERYLTTLGSQGNFTGALSELKTLMEDEEASVFARPACHDTTHALGRLAFQQAGSVEEAFSMGDSTCNMGFFHGVVEGLGEAVETPEDLLKVMRTVCAPFPAGERFEVCAHGLGHAAMKAYGNELDPSVSACLLLEAPSKDTCLAGVFMEWVKMYAVDGYTPVVTPRTEPLDASLENVFPPGLCMSMPETQRGPCFKEMFQTLYNTATVEDMKESVRWCKGMSDCVEGVGLRLPFILSSAHQSAFDVCAAAQTEDLARSCMREYLLSWVSYTHSEQALQEACDQLPAKFAGACEDARMRSGGSALILE